MYQVKSIIYIDASEAEESFNILEVFGEDALLEHLKQWEDGDEEIVEMEELPKSSGHRRHVTNPDGGGYMMEYSYSYGYVALDRIMNYGT